MAFVRFVLALVAFLWLLSPFAAFLTPPDPFTQILGLGVGAVGAVPAAVVFVRRSHSLKRLYGYLLAVNLTVLPLGFGFIGAVWLTERISGTTLQGFGPVWALVQTTFLLVAYLLTFHLVYRGGYARLKTRFA